VGKPRRKWVMRKMNEMLNDAAYIPEPRYSQITDVKIVMSRKDSGSICMRKITETLFSLRSPRI
jgi:hypothetical protein